MLVVHNLGGSAVTAGPYALPAAALEPITVDDGVGQPQAAAGGWTIALPPRASGMWRMR